MKSIIEEKNRINALITVVHDETARSKTRRCTKYPTPNIPVLIPWPRSGEILHLHRCIWLELEKLETF